VSRAKPEPPVFRKNGRDETVEEHPAYALIGAARVSSSHGQHLFGSDFDHRHFVMIRVRPAERHRHLSSDWIHGKHNTPYIELALSESQWASFVSSMNVGDGVPCTLEYVNGREVPGIESTPDRKAQFGAELRETFEEAERLTDSLEQLIESANLSQSRKESMRSILTQLRNRMSTSTSFVAKQFGKHVEETLDQARTEASALIQNALTTAGLAHLAEAKEMLRTLKEETSKETE
jgi:hypothetical protein